LSAKPDLQRLVTRFDCVACGPGLGRSEALTELVRWLYAWLPLPLVVDADGLNALAGPLEAQAEATPPGPTAAHAETRSGQGARDQRANLAVHAGPRILTPHVGEFRRLLGAADATPDQWGQLAPEFAATHQVVLVLKGQHTQITDGVRRAINRTGNPGLATGGSGDVLTGLILALLGQGLEPFAAAQLAVHVHGLAGDMAAEHVGQVGMISSDLPDLLPAALATVEAEA
jgi:ADP-dependent NAD(P)H-hydrate dehydratase